MTSWKEKLSTFWIERLRFQLRAYWDILWDARGAFVRDGCLNLSAALAFYTILSLIPLLFLLMSAVGYVMGSSDEAYRLTLSFFERFAPQANPAIFDEVKALAQRASVLGWVGVLAMVWTASLIFSSLEYAMGVVFRVERQRNFLKSKLMALSMVPGSILIFLLSLSTTPILRVMQILDVEFWGFSLGKSGFFDFLVGYLFPYLILTVGFTAIYKIIPPIKVAFHYALAGGASGALLFEVAKHFFGWYIGRTTHYNFIYGSLEAFVILVVWVFYSSTILLFCAEVVSAYRRRDITLLEKAFI
jgi:membrane protein